MSEHRERGPRWYAGLTIFVVAVTLGVLNNLKQDASQKRTDHVVCEIIAESAATERGRLQAYEAEPPATQAGKAQREASREALARWEHRARDLGCPPEQE